MQMPDRAVGAAVCIGVDVDSKLLNLTRASAATLDSPVTTIANTATAIKAWLKTLPPGCRIGMEANGKYHRTLAVLIGRRHQIDKQRTSLKMSLADVPECAAQIRTLKNAFKRLLATIDAQIHAAFAGEHELQLQRQRLCTIHGFGPLVSAAVAARLSRVPYANSDAVVAAFGMDPRPRDSGQFKGRRCLSKRGNAEERRLIYLAAVSACNNPLFRAIRDTLLLKGMTAIQAHCVIARKLLRIAFAVWTSGQPFNPGLIGKAVDSKRAMSPEHL